MEKNNKITIGFIGCGNMAVAMIGGIVRNNRKDYDIIASNRSLEKLLRAKEEYGIHITQDNKEVVEKSDVVILAVKPKLYKEVAEEINNYLKPETIVVSITIGYTLSDLKKFFKYSSTLKIIRAMPNTPCMVGEGMTALCKSWEVKDEELDIVIDIFNNFSKTALIDEDLFESFVAISGSSPAYIYMFIEALADGAVLHGMPRELAYQFASQAVLGSAKMVLETNMHPAILKDNVCSPAGSTIEAVKVLEKNAFRSTIIQAISACVEKAKKI